MSNLDIAKRAVACKHWRWMRGMAAVTASGAHFLRGTDTWEWDDHGALPGGPPQSEIAALLSGELFPDLTDAATLGCLLALVREAWTDPGISCVIWSFRNGIYYWRVVDGRHQGSDFYAMSQIMRLTEAEALVAALEAAPC